MHQNFPDGFQFLKCEHQSVVKMKIYLLLCAITSRHLVDSGEY